MTLPGAFFFVHSLSQCSSIIIRPDQYRHLEDNRTIIIADVVNKMHRHGTLGYFPPMIGCHDGLVHKMSVHTCSAKLWQWSRVNVDGFCGIESSYKLQPAGAHDKVSLIFLDECSITFGIKGSGPILKRDLKSVRFSTYSSVLMVRNDSDYLSVKDRRIGTGKLDQFLKTRASTLFIAARKN